MGLRTVRSYATAKLVHIRKIDLILICPSPRKCEWHTSCFVQQLASITKFIYWAPGSEAHISIFAYSNYSGFLVRFPLTK